MLLKDGMVTTRLPRAGSGKARVPYQSDESIVFDKKPVELIKDLSKASKGKYIYSFDARIESDDARNDNGYLWHVQLQLFATGKAVITCSNSFYSMMRYEGIIIPRN